MSGLDKSKLQLRVLFWKINDRMTFLKSNFVVSWFHETLIFVSLQKHIYASVNHL